MTLRAMRCNACGNTWPTEEPDPICPLCGSDEVHEATEPAL